MTELIKLYLVKSTNHIDTMKCIIVEAENEIEMKSLVERFNTLYCWDGDLYDLHSFVEISDVGIKRLFEVVNKTTMLAMENENDRLYNH